MASYGKENRIQRKISEDLVHEKKWEHGHLQAKESDLKEAKPTNLSLGFSILQMWEKKSLLWKSLNVVLCFEGSQELIFWIYIC